MDSATDMLTDSDLAASIGAAVSAGMESEYLPPGFRGLYREPFTYNVIFNPIANGVTAQGTTNINNDSYFACIEQTATIWDSATERTTNTQPNVAPMLVKIVDSSSGKYMMDQVTPLGNLFGTALQPFIWLHRAKMYRPGGQIQVDLTNQMAASQAVRLSFIGFKVYRVPDSAESM